ncbi:MAG: endonuclease Q family protein [Lacunisphaera sp.]
MLRAVDLHLHSHYASAVSPAMTLPNIARMAQRKGLDILSTGDCLQPQWLEEIRTTLMPAEPGLLALNESAAEAVAAETPPHLQRDLRFVLGTEVCCVPPGTREIEGLHHLLYFSSIEEVRRFREAIAPFGDLAEGRPTLRLSSRELLEKVLALGADSHVVPAHVFNPWFSALGTVGGGYTLEDCFGDLTFRLSAVETGLTSTPPMCRRVASLDRFNLFSCSDAHSLENLGREYTLVDIEPGYAALFAALRSSEPGRVTETVKFPIERTRYYRNRCTYCQKSFAGEKCPRCGRDLVPGSHDRLEEIASRREPAELDNSPPFQQLLPLAYVIAGLQKAKRTQAGVARLQRRLVEAIGSERFILREASPEAIAEVGTKTLAKAIVRQRTVPPGPLPPEDAGSGGDQLSLDF